MIPKIIHYCWFGKKEKPESVQKTINNWKNLMPDFDVIEWNENNFDVNSVDFVKKSYTQNKFAFVSDYVRLHALYNFGGIYLDTDVEVIKPLDSLIGVKAFIGFENDTTLMTGLIASTKKNEWILEILNFYENNEFENEKKEFKVLANTLYVTNLTKSKYNFNFKSNEIQNIKDELIIYPFEYFCAKDWRTGEINISNNTMTIHHYSGSWLTKKQKVLLYGKRYFNILFGRKKYANN
ncbi:glycosyltransferase family 32 protein [Exiguobacterium sp. s144]|uniref:glycosyltransferase family 32 protein n=1 Tax=Exiguobacterium sp. s144 TaxID=2751195 RepID=UPI001BE8653E|nr:glycosyltransferase [Exiguobacterium sp. s144]